MAFNRADFHGAELCRHNEHIRAFVNVDSKDRVPDPTIPDYCSIGRRCRNVSTEKRLKADGGDEG